MVPVLQTSNFMLTLATTPRQDFFFSTVFKEVFQKLNTKGCKTKQKGINKETIKCVFSYIGGKNTCNINFAPASEPTGELLGWTA